MWKIVNVKYGLLCSPDFAEIVNIADENFEYKALEMDGTVLKWTFFTIHLRIRTASFREGIYWDREILEWGCGNSQSTLSWRRWNQRTSTHRGIGTFFCLSARFIWFCQCRSDKIRKKSLINWKIHLKTSVDHGRPREEVRPGSAWSLQMGRRNINWSFISTNCYDVYNNSTIRTWKKSSIPSQVQ